MQPEPTSSERVARSVAGRRLDPSPMQSTTQQFYTGSLGAVTQGRWAPRGPVADAVDWRATGPYPRHRTTRPHPSTGEADEPDDTILPRVIRQRLLLMPGEPDDTSQAPHLTTNTRRLSSASRGEPAVARGWVGGGQAGRRVMAWAGLSGGHEAEGGAGRVPGAGRAERGEGRACPAGMNWRGKERAMTRQSRHLTTMPQSPCTRIIHLLSCRRIFPVGGTRARYPTAPAPQGPREAAVPQWGHGIGGAGRMGGGGCRPWRGRASPTRTRAPCLPRAGSRIAREAERAAFRTRWPSRGGSRGCGLLRESKKEAEACMLRVMTLLVLCP